MNSQFRSIESGLNANSILVDNPHDFGQMTVTIHVRGLAILLPPERPQSQLQPTNPASETPAMEQYPDVNSLHGVHSLLTTVARVLALGGVEAVPLVRITGVLVVHSLTQTLQPLMMHTIQSSGVQ